MEEFGHFIPACISVNKLNGFSLSKPFGEFKEKITSLELIDHSCVSLINLMISPVSFPLDLGLVLVCIIRLPVNRCGS